MSKRSSGLPLVLVLLALAGIAACTTHDAVMSDQEIRQSFQLGDEVCISAKDGTYFRFTVTEVTTEAIVGDDISVPVSNISRLDSSGSAGGGNASGIAGAAVYSFIFAVINGVGMVVMSGF